MKNGGHLHQIHRYQLERSLEKNLHIDGSEGTVGNSTADSTSQGESGVQVDTGELLWNDSRDGADLGGSSSSHCI